MKILEHYCFINDLHLLMVYKHQSYKDTLLFFRGPTNEAFTAFLVDY